MMIHGKILFILTSTRRLEARKWAWKWALSDFELPIDRFDFNDEIIVRHTSTSLVLVRDKVGFTIFLSSVVKRLNETMNMI